MNKRNKTMTPFQVHITGPSLENGPLSQTTNNIPRIRAQLNPDDIEQ